MSADPALGISTWTLNGLLPEDLRRVADGADACRPSQSQAVRVYFAEMVTAILHSGVKSVQLWYSQVFEDETVAEQIRRLGTSHRVHSMHAPFGPELDISSADSEARATGIEACLKAANLLHVLGGSVLVIHGSAGAMSAAEMPERSRSTVLSTRKIADGCAPLGIDVALELLPGLAVGGSAPELLTLMELVDRPNVGVCVDTNHVFPADQLSITVTSLGSFIRSLHIADFDGCSEQHWVPGRGCIDWESLIHDLRHVRCTAPFTYEVRFQADSLEEALAALEQNYAALMAH